ncbi:hypothetical protein [Streptomyces parvus]|uniref:hypothetical protein n=1 Tax=Streptomyces parvus TaxID=66428 RepID=UPI002101567B|nr:hypothetical protein [Streptomyces parvus]MCQ1582305.1 hypothetical protein [Streptomyces parvus]
MIRLVRSSTLREMNAQTVEMHNRASDEYGRAEGLVVDVANAQALLEEERTAACDMGENLLRSQDLVETLEKALAAARDDLARAQGELNVLRSQQLLDTEDRAALRALLRIARRQQARPDRVHVLYRYGRLHSVHSTRDDAEIAAEDEGADRAGWTSPSETDVAPNPNEIAWRIQPMALGSVK